MTRHFRSIELLTKGWSVFAALLLMSLSLFAQESSNSESGTLSSSNTAPRSQFNFLATHPVQHSNSALDSSGNTLSNAPTGSAGFMLSYGFTFNKWLRMEAGWAASRNSQRFTGPSGGTELQGDMNQLTAEEQFVIPTHSAKFVPFGLIGIGAVKFAPTDFTKGNIPDAQSQSKFATVFGGGVDLGIGRGFGLRAEYRGLVTQSPWYNLPQFGATDTLVVSEPVIGLFYKF